MAGPGAEIGALLVQVQEDLQQLKEKLRGISQGWESADVGSLEAAIERTESGLRKHAEKYLNVVNTSVLTISPSESTGLCSRQISKWGIPVETSQKDIVFPEISAVSVPRGTSSPPVSPRSKVRPVVLPLALQPYRVPNGLPFSLCSVQEPSRSNQSSLMLEAPRQGRK
ncbi:UNVERIFIED_CONTAM: hypothetical protein K2H54_023361 [Gekko kuhli]